MAGIALRVVVIALGLGSCATAELPRWASDGDDVDVFRAVLSSNCERPEGKFIVVSDASPLPGHSDLPADWVSSSSLSAVLSQRSQVRIRWPHVKACAGAHVVDESVIQSLFAQDTRVPPGWEAFYSHFPGATGLVRVSLPAFTSDRKRAVVYAETRCGTSCGSGFYVELGKKKGVWSILRQATAWIS